MRTPLRRVSLVVALALVAGSARAHAAPDLSPQRAAEKAANEPAPAATVSAPASSTKLWLKRSAWIAGAGAAVATGLGVFLKFRADAKVAEFNGRRNGMGHWICNSAEPMHGGPGCSALYEESRSAKRWSLAGLGAGAVLAVSSGVLALVALNQDEGPRVAVAPGELAASWRLRF